MPLSRQEAFDENLLIGNSLLTVSPVVIAAAIGIEVAILKFANTNLEIGLGVAIPMGLVFGLYKALNITSDEYNQLTAQDEENRRNNPGDIYL